MVLSRATYLAARVNVSSNAFLSSRSEKHLFFDVELKDISNVG